MRVPKGGIAFFDSGIGGLTVLSAYEKYIKNVACAREEQVLYYYGDNRHAPYGNLSERKILRYVKRAFRRFRRLNVRAVVLACNTATAVCVEKMRAEFPFPIIGTEPAVLAASKEGGRIFVLATPATCKSERFRRLCILAQERYPSAQIYPMPCEGLAGAIERGIVDNRIDYIPFLPQGKPSAVVLGCTHYTYIKEQIQEYYGCKIYDGNEGVARQIFTVFEGRGEKNRDGRPPVEKNPPNLGKTTTFTLKKRAKKAIKIKTNKRSRKNGKTGVNYMKNGQNSTVFFIGADKKNNEKTYKQMFGVKENR